MQNIPSFVFWADGKSDEMSKSKFYYGEPTGERNWELPYDMQNEFAESWKVG